jgi:hypothetical protein
MPPKTLRSMALNGLPIDTSETAAPPAARPAAAPAPVAGRSQGRRRRADWQSIVDEYASSGLGIIEFARQKDLCAGTLRFWRWKLGRSEAEKMEHRLAERASGSKLPGQRIAQDVAWPEGARHTIVVDIAPDGQMQIRVPLGADVEQVARLVSAMRKTMRSPASAPATYVDLPLADLSHDGADVIAVSAVTRDPTPAEYPRPSAKAPPLPKVADPPP